MATEYFFTQIAKLTSQAIMCQRCLDQATRNGGDAAHIGLPQPGWIGPRYPESLGIVFVLQNPGQSPESWDEWGRAGQERPKLFAQKPDTASYRVLVDETIKDVLGNRPGKWPWHSWSRLLEPALGGHYAIEEIGWYNASNVRTPENARVSSAALEHGRAAHLGPVLRHLRPRAPSPSGTMLRTRSTRSADHGRVGI